MSGRAGIIEYGIDRFNDYCRALVQRTTDAWERYVTRQARWVDFANDYKTMDLSYMESVMWAFKTPVGQGPALRGRPGPALLLGVRDPAVQLRDPPGRRLPGPPGPGRHGAPSRSTPTTAAGPGRDRRAAAGAGVDDDAVDPCRRTWPSPSGPTSTTPSTSSWASPPSSPPSAPRPTPSCSATPSPWHGARAPRSWAAPTGPCSTSSPTQPDAFRVLGGRLRRHRRGHRRRPPGPGFGEEDHDVCEAAGIAVVCPVDDRARFTDRGPRPTPGQQVFDANRAITADLQGGRGAGRAPSPTPTATPTAGAPTRPSSTRR